MVRLQILLDDVDARALRLRAAEEGRPMAELVREGVDRVLGSRGGPARDERKRRAVAAAGRFRSGTRDLGTDHDAHLASAFSE